VCGAGDTVLASLGTAMLAGNSIRQAYRFALVAARQQIARVGISTVAADVDRRRATEKELYSEMI